MFCDSLVCESFFFFHAQVTHKVKQQRATKDYHFERISPFPPLISSLSKDIVTLCEPLLPSYSGTNYRPEAGIVNFYSSKDTLMAHQDRSEPDNNSPLVSISLGLSCVFLIGTESRDDRPVPILLRSGDCLIMSGPCRRAFHGVPRIVEGSCPDFLKEGTTDEEGGEEWKGTFFCKYMQDARININVRQVYP